MLKIAILALLIAIVAGALGLGGLSHFAMGVSKFFFSAFGLVLLFCILLAFFAWRAFAG
jgi:uncharacterized membrane protein YtjA (UPF0391 family)